MSALADRLRGVLGTANRPVAPAPRPVRGGDGDVTDVLGGQWHDADGRSFVVVERKYSPGHRHGHTALADYLPPSDASWPTLPLLMTQRRDSTGAASELGRALFLDLETTGLAGGAGTYAFLVGCGWFDGAVFRIRQFFLADYAAERALLTALTTLAAECGAVVTYNGKTFDVPLIETRLTMHRLATPFTALEHVDMLHPARRLWKGEDDEAAGTQSSCRLSVLEQTVCGHVREGDVPGFEIPGRYFHYVRTGDARPLEPVLEHNRLDLLSLALVTAHVAQLLESGAPAARTCRESLGLGRLYERAGRIADAKACYTRAERLDGVVADRADAIRAYAVLCRRERRHEEAAAAWRRLLDLRGCPANLTREATEALAVHHEHRLRDPLTARGFALQSLRVRSTAARSQALQHRLARLNRKLGDPPPALF